MAALDALSAEEELDLVDLDQRMLEAETCVLQAGDRVLRDLGDEAGFRAGKVVRLDDAGRVCVLLDGERTEQALDRSDRLYKAPPPTTLRVKDLVRLAFDDNALDDTMRWEYGRVTKVYSGKELLDVDLDNGQQLRVAPSYDISPVQMEAH